MTLQAALSFKFGGLLIVYLFDYLKPSYSQVGIDDFCRLPGALDGFIL